LLKTNLTIGLLFFFQNRPPTKLPLLMTGFEYEVPLSHLFSCSLEIPFFVPKGPSSLFILPPAIFCELHAFILFLVESTWGGGCLCLGCGALPPEPPDNGGGAHEFFPNKHFNQSVRKVEDFFSSQGLVRPLLFTSPRLSLSKTLPLVRRRRHLPVGR